MVFRRLNNHEQKWFILELTYANLCCSFLKCIVAISKWIEKNIFGNQLVKENDFLIVFLTKRYWLGIRNRAA